MNATKPATPLPWKIVSERANEGMTAPVESEVRGDNRQVAVRLGRLYNDSQKADAAYIVTACNAYPRLLAEREELVKALREACSQLAAVSGLVNSYPRPSLDPNGRTLLDAVEMPKAAYHKHRALLAKLEAA